MVVTGPPRWVLGMRLIPAHRKNIRLRKRKKRRLTSSSGGCITRTTDVGQSRKDHRNLVKLPNHGVGKKPAGMAFVGGCYRIGGRPGWMSQSSGRPQESSWTR